MCGVEPISAYLRTSLSPCLDFAPKIRRSIKSKTNGTRWRRCFQKNHFPKKLFRYVTGRRNSESNTHRTIRASKRHALDTLNTKGQRQRSEARPAYRPPTTAPPEGTTRDNEECRSRAN